MMWSPHVWFHIVSCRIYLSGNGTAQWCRYVSGRLVPAIDRCMILRQLSNVLNRSFTLSRTWTAGCLHIVRLYMGKQKVLWADADTICFLHHCMMEFQDVCLPLCSSAWCNCTRGYIRPRVHSASVWWHLGRFVQSGSCRLCACPNRPADGAGNCEHAFSWIFLFPVSLNASSACW